jgi:hypothetical protein
VHKPAAAKGEQTRKASLNLTRNKTFICQSQRDYERMLSLNGTVYEPRRRADGRISSAGKVALNLAVIDYNDQTANPPRPCTHQQVSNRLLWFSLANAV